MPQSPCHKAPLLPEEGVGGGGSMLSPRSTTTLVIDPSCILPLKRRGDELSVVVGPGFLLPVRSNNSPPPRGGDQGVVVYTLYPFSCPSTLILTPVSHHHTRYRPSCILPLRRRGDNLSVVVEPGFLLPVRSNNSPPPRGGNQGVVDYPSPASSLHPDRKHRNSLVRASCAARSQIVLNSIPASFICKTVLVFN